MARLIVRRVRPAPSRFPLGAVALGLTAGLAVGFLVGELAGPAPARDLMRRARPARPGAPVRDLVRRAQAALDDDLMLREARLEVVAAGRRRIELHGWVADRRSRARAARLVGDAVHADAIINCLLVRGEDDVPAPIDEPDAGELLA